MSETTTEKPYTDEDLRAEAARQHHELTTDPDFMGVGEAMEDSTVPSTEDAGTPRTWDDVLRENADDYEQYNAVQRKVHDLINGAADVSAWAVALGANGLEPEDHALSVDGDGTPLVRMHLAFHPDMPDGARQAFVMRLGQLMAEAL